MKTDRQYEQAFEDLMTYSRFTSVNQIKTREDLRTFFGQIKTDAESRDRKFPLTKKLVFKFSEAVSRLQRQPVKIIPTRRSEVITSRKVFTSFRVAQEQMLVTTNIDEIAVYKSKVVIRKKTIIVYRGRKGRFARAPVVVKKK